jgi:hypothetical protein
MTRATTTLRWFLCFALLELLRPLMISGQDDNFIAAGAQFTTPRAWALTDKLSTTTPSLSPSPGLSSQMYGQHGSGGQTFADTLAFQRDRGSASAWMTETYLTTRPTFVALQPKEWSNSFAGGGTWFLTKSNTTALHFMGNLDASTTNVGGLLFEQYDGSYLTLRWGMSRLFLSNTGRNDLQIDVAGYGEHMVSPPHLPIPFYMADPTGYASSSSGVEATFSLPSRNAVLSVRYGSERMMQQPIHSRLLQFQLTWSW